MGAHAGTRDGGVRSVMVVDDHRTVADLLRLAIDGDPGLSCVAVSYDVDTAERVFDELLPDVVVTDVHFAPGDRDGLDLAKSVTSRERQTKVVLLTGDTGGLSLDRLGECGASAVITKDGDLNALLSVIHRAVNGGLEIDPRLLRRLTSARSVPRVVLSPRERQVLDLLHDGLDVTGIARSLGIRASTCRSYVKSLLTKLDAHSQLEALAIARKMGLLDGPRNG